MSQPTTWGVPRIGDAPQTPEDYADRDDDSLDALLSSNSGTARPAYALAGTVWHNTNNAGLYYYDGTSDLLLPKEIIVSNTALADAAATLTAAEILGRLFTITPTIARIQTTDTAVNILGAMPAHIDGSNFQFTISNLAAFDVTLAAGTDVTLVGDMVLNNESGTFMVYRTSATEVTLVRL